MAAFCALLAIATAVFLVALVVAAVTGNIDWSDDEATGCYTIGQQVFCD